MASLQTLWRILVMGLCVTLLGACTEQSLTRPAPTSATGTPPTSFPVEGTKPTASPATATPPPSVVETATPPRNAEIAFIGADGLLRLLALDGDRETLVTERGRAISPAWSPDGNGLIYCMSESDAGPWSIMVYRPEDSSQEQLARPDGPVQGVTWSPSGRLVAVECGTSMASELLIVEAPSGRIVHDLAIMGGYSWSPDGGRIVFGQRRPLDKPISLEAGDSVSLAVLDIGQAEARVILEGTSQVLYFPKAWLPDGRILYWRLDWDEKQQSGAWTTWTVALGDRTAEPEPAQRLPLAYDPPALLARLPSEFQDPTTTAEFSWSPEGRWVVFRAGPCPPCGIYLYDVVEGGAPNRLADGTSPTWRPGPGS